jgi:hypothetical protein
LRGVQGCLPWEGHHESQAHRRRARPRPLAGCGAESVGAAATGAAVKKQELQQRQKTMEQAKDKINQAMELQQQRAGQNQ